MTVQEILDSKGPAVFSIEADAGVASAARVMSEHNIASLVVMRDNHLVGMLSHRDIVRGLSEYGAQLLELRVAHLMQREFVTVSPLDSVQRVMALMTRRRTTHIPVLADQHLVGLVSIGDVVRYRIDDLELEANVLRDVYIAAH